MATRPVTILTYAQIYGASIGNGNIANGLANLLRSTGWNISNVNVQDAPDVAPNTIQILVNANVDIIYIYSDITASLANVINSMVGLQVLNSPTVLTDGRFYSPYNTPPPRPPVNPSTPNVNPIILSPPPPQVVANNPPPQSNGNGITDFLNKNGISVSAAVILAIAIGVVIKTRE